MIRSTGPLTAMDTAALEWSEAGEPQSRVYADCYYSSGHGPQESRHVFLHGNQLQERLQRPGPETFVVGELGFGSGLNFLLTWETFCKHAPPGKRLHYWSIDRHPLSRADLQRSLHRHPEFKDRITALLDAYPPPLEGVHRRSLGEGRITLDFVWADVDTALEEIAGMARPNVDAWYLDGFAPTRNAQMWSEGVFHRISAASRPAASFATYSAAGSVRRGLTKAGFSVDKRPGYGRKRESLCGQLSQRAAPPETGLTPWDLPQKPTAASPESVLIIGAGLAGAHAAAALAKRDIAVTVLDAGSSAGRASGNPQGVLFTRLSHQRSTLTDFSVLAFLYSQHLYETMFDQGSLQRGLDGEFGGCFQGLSTQTPNAKLQTALGALPELGSIINNETAEALLGETVRQQGLWQPNSGWLAPPAVCTALLKAPEIKLLENCGTLRLKHDISGKWEAVNSRGTVIASAKSVIIAAGTESRAFQQCSELPLKVVRGQTTQIPSPADRTLKAAYCHKGYIAPAVRGEHCIGASFLPGDEDVQLRAGEHEANLQALALALPEWKTHLESLDVDTLSGKAALRCVSPDYLPMAGPIPDTTAFLSRFAALGKDARQPVLEHGDYLPDLYLSTAYGSRGLSYAALGAELLASQICGEPAPLSRELQRALAPARFLIRGIIRGTA